MSSTETHANLATSVSRLDGFLYAVSNFSGNIREYESRAFFVFGQANKDTLETLINAHYRGQYEFTLGSLSVIGDLKLLEDSLLEFLIGGESPLQPDRIHDIKQVVLLRIMDMIADIFSSYQGSILRIYKALENLNSKATGTVFFCLVGRDGLLVIQFNHYP